MARKAFTIVEVLLMAVVFIVITTVAVVNFSSFRGSARLRAAAQEVAASIKQAQFYAYTSKKQDVCLVGNTICNPGVSTCLYGCATSSVFSYGVALNPDLDGKTYKVFANPSLFPELTYSAAKVIPGGAHTLPTGITFDSITPLSNTPMYFTYNVYALQNRYIDLTDRSFLGPFSACSSDCTTTIVLFDALTSQTKTIVVQKQTGAVSIY